MQFRLNERRASDRQIASRVLSIVTTALSCTVSEILVENLVNQYQ